MTPHLSFTGLFSCSCCVKPEFPLNKYDLYVEKLTVHEMQHIKLYNDVVALTSGSK